MESLLKRIQELCKKEEISVPQLEQTLGFGRGALYKWEKSSPSTDKLRRVADYFGVSLDYLMGLTDEPLPLAELVRRSRAGAEAGGVAVGFGGPRTVVPPRSGYALVNYAENQTRELTQAQYKQVTAFLNALEKN